MPPVKLERDTLGKKRQHYNKLVEDAIANKHYELCNISGDDSDIDNLLKIDIASKIRNVDFIIEVLKCNDMLYAATAIKKSTWLITEPQYANIINPEYLHTQLLPSMNTKTFNKLMLHIRLNLKDESRVEAFYEYLKETDSAYKWLQNCSIPFIENVFKNERTIPLYLFKRLCRRSARFLPYFSLAEPRNARGIYQVEEEILFLLKSHTTEVLNIVEDKTVLNYVPEMRKKKTEFLMKNCWQRVLDNFDTYAYAIDLSVVAQYLNKKEIKTFLYKQARSLEHSLYDLNTLRYFIKNMPQEERFEFVKKTFIDKTEMALLYTEDGRRIIESRIKPYQWYEFAPFDVAFPEIKKLIRKKNSSFERCAMLSILVTCTQNNPQHIKTLLIFFNAKHVNEPFKYKIRFINRLLSQISTHKIDAETWNILNQLYHSLEVYTESENNVQLCLQSISLYKVLQDEPVPEIVEKKMTINSFKKIQIKLTQEQNDKIFTYLINSALTKIQSKNIANESDFQDTLLHLLNALTLLRDWKKDISKFPFVLEKIQELIKIKQENMWNTDMSCLYFIKKSWRKHMFEESLSLCLSEETCLNALKHKPQLLMRHDAEIDTLRTNDTVSLRRLLAKLRVYWPHSLAQHWIDAYLLHLNKPTGQKAVVKGLFMLLSQNQIVDLAKTQIPNNFKITWGETDQREISIRKNVAKHLHVARPLIPLDAVLWYAKGDYLQHAVPSLNAILYNMSEVDSREHLPKLLDASVSLQKFGLHLAVFKLKSDVLKPIFLKTWKSTTNLTIRSVLFKHTYNKICRVKNPTVEKELWELIRLFMNELHSGESTEIYKKIGNVEKVPISIRAEYFMKGFEFLTSLPDSANCGKYVKELIQYAPEIIELLDEDFVANKLLSRAGYDLCLYGSEIIEILACYVLVGKSEEDQLQRFRKVVGPAMEEAFQCWGRIQLDRYYVKDNFDNFLKHLVRSFTLYVTLNKIPIPVKLFLEIKNKIEQYLPVIENYVLYTSWKLIAEYVKLIHEHATSMSALGSSKWTESDFTSRRSSCGVDSPWIDIHLKIAPSLGPIIVKCLKEDTEQYSSAIYCLFADALEAMFHKLHFQDDLFVSETQKNMLNENDFIPSYLVVSKSIGNYYCDNDELKCVRSEIRKKLESNSSLIVRVNYYKDFRHVTED